MPRFIGIPVAAALLAAFAPAIAGDRVVAVQGSATIVAPASIAVSHDLTLASVQLRAASALDDALGRTGRISTSARRGLLSQRVPASFILSGTDEQSVSWTVPDAIALVRIGGTERLTVATWADPATKALAGRGAADGLRYLSSLRVGGRIAIDDETVAGTYRGVLVATAQYN